MKVLIACEYSGIVRDAFAAKGHNAWSCDILPTESPGNHYQGDVLEHLEKYDMFRTMDLLGLRKAMFGIFDPMRTFRKTCSGFGATGIYKDI